MKQIDLIIDALLVAESSVWSAKIAEALVAALELKALAPPRKEWVGLTEGELIDIKNCNRGFWTNAAKIEQLLKDKNT